MIHNVVSIWGGIASLKLTGIFGPLTLKDIENFGAAKQRIRWALSLHAREKGSGGENDCGKLGHFVGTWDDRRFGYCGILVESRI